MTLGDRVAVLTPGAFASIPPGLVHTFRNDSAQISPGVRLRVVGESPGWGGWSRPVCRQLPGLLFQVLLAFTIEFERESDVSLAISANVVRLVV